MNRKKLESMSTANIGPCFRAGGSVIAAILLLASTVQGQEAKSTPPASEPEPAVERRLVEVKRVCVQPFGPDTLSIQVQEMVIAKLFEAKRFSLTENCERADFVLKGSVTERSDYVSRSESEGIGFSQQASGSQSSSSRFGSSGSSSSSSASGGLSGNSQESLSSTETKQQAAVTLRIVAKDGEIIWATSQESGVGKSKGAVGLAAEQAVRRLLRDKERAEKQASPAPPRN